MKNKKQVLFIHLLKSMCVLSLFIITSSCTEQVVSTTKESKGQVTTAIPVQVQKVDQVLTTGKKLRYSGTVKAKNKVGLAFQVPGKVNQLRVKVGDQVRKGQELASLENTDYVNQLDMNDANLKLAQDAFDRIAVLHKKKSIPESRYVEAKMKLQQAAAQYKITQKQLADARLYAPFSGTISQKNIEKGMLVNGGVTAFEVVNLYEVDVVVSIPEQEIGAIKLGDKALISVSAMSIKDKEGRVKEISPIADPTSRTFQVKVVLTNSFGLLEGMLAEVSFKSGSSTQKALAVPGNSLLKSSKLGTHVFVIDESGKAKAVKVEVGDFIGEKVTIIQGLTGSEEVIVAGQHKLQDGSLIKI